MNTLTLFAGAGGADIGLKAAGCHHIECVEGDANAVYTLIAAGFPGVHGWIGQPPEGITTKRWEWNGQPIDILWASPPCQPFSSAGLRKGSDDSRNGWPATLEAIKQIKPRCTIIENVGGAPATDWVEQLQPLYKHVEARFLDAADWGLPSHRRRWFIIAGDVPIRWPKPTHYGPDAPWMLRIGLQPWNSIGQALGIDPNCRYYPMGTTSQFTPPEGYDVLTPATAMTTRGNQYLTLPSPTICGADSHGLGSVYSRDYVEKATGRRALKWQECAILMGFPADYPFQGNIGQHYKQIGNAVAPIMAEVIGRAVIEAFKSQ